MLGPIWRIAKVLVDATGDGIVDMEIELQNQHTLTTAVANALKADIII